MSTIDTISELLSLSDSQFRVYDIGRRIDKISKNDFEKIEHNQLPYPFPIQGNAHIALAFWQKKTQAPYLWFIKLPLDERGLLNQGARNHFIAIIVDALGKDLTVDPTQQQEELLKSNPYNFTPAQYKLASLNAKLTVELKRNASSYYEHAQLYFSGKLGWHDYQNVGVQGIADFCARLSNTENEQALVNAISKLPMAVYSVLCSALENEHLNHQIIEQLIHRYYLAKDNEEQQITLRALASSTDHVNTQQLITDILAAKTLPEDLLIIISARCWQALNSDANMMSYLEQLARTKNTNLFVAMFKDMVAIPLLRHHVLACIRSPERSNELAQAIGDLFNQTNKRS